jgi:2'-5' RNA ligase
MFEIDLKKHYDQMWEQALAHYRLGQFALDPWLDRPGDDRRGITILWRPDASVKKEIQAFLAALRSVVPDQYFYPDPDIHLTLMSVISCYEGFELDQINVSDYVDVLSGCVKGISSFSLHFKGVTASGAGVMIQGFPENDQLDQLRDRLREGFRHSDLENSLDKRYRIRTAHSTVMRFRKKVEQAGLLIEVLESFRQHDFGAAQVRELELVFNDWYQRREKVKLLHVFSL